MHWYYYLIANSMFMFYNTSLLSDLVIKREKIDDGDGLEEFK